MTCGLDLGSVKFTWRRRQWKSRAIEDFSLLALIVELMMLKHVKSVIILSTFINFVDILCYDEEEDAIPLDPDVAGRVKRSGGGHGGYDVWYECQTSNTGKIPIVIHFFLLFLNRRHHLLQACSASSLFRSC